MEGTAPAGKDAVPHLGTHRPGGPPHPQRGVSLIEMLVVVTLLAILAGVSFPSMSSGIDSFRLTQATNQVVTLLNGGLNRAERRQEGVEVTIAPVERTLALRSTDPRFQKEVMLADGIRITRVLPMVPGLEPDAPRRFLLLPGGTVPRIGVELANARNGRRIVTVDPVTGVPQVTVPEDGS